MILKGIGQWVQSNRFLSQKQEVLSREELSEKKRSVEETPSLIEVDNYEWLRNRLDPSACFVRHSVG